jgi:hypothetical protein
MELRTFRNTGDRGMRFYNLVFFILFTTLQAYADNADCQHCDQYESFLEVGSLAEEVSEIGTISSFNPAGSAFTSTQQYRRLKRDVQAMIPDECSKYLRNKKTSKKDFSLEARYFQLNKPKTYKLSDQDAQEFVKTYQAAFQSQVDFCFVMPTSKDCQKSNQTFSNNLKSKANAEAIFTSVGAALTSDQIKLMQAYDLVLQAGTEKNLLNMIKSNRLGLTKDQTLTLVQMVGYRLSLNFDQNRLNQGYKAKGAVTGDELIQASLFNTRIGFSEGGVILFNDPDYAGVCRDIASLQGKILDAAGFKNTYVVDFSLKNGGYHVSVVTQDPEQKKTVYKFDYGNLVTTSGADGSRVLYQGSKDASMSYRILKPGGKSVAELPSEAGKLFAETSGFDIRVLDPLARPTASIIAPGTNFGDQGQYGARLFAAQDGNGNEYAGAGANITWGQADQGSQVGNLSNNLDRVRFPGRLGASAAFVGPQLISELSSKDSGAQVYSQIEQHMQVDIARSNSGSKLTSDSIVTAVGAYGGFHNLTDGDRRSMSPYGLQGSLYFDERLVYRQGNPSDNFHGKYMVGAQIAPGFQDARAIDRFNVFVNHVYARGEVSTRFGNQKGREIAALVVDHNLDLGSRGYFEAGYAGEICGMTAQVSGRLKEQTTLIMDRTIRRAGVTMMCSNAKAKFRLIGETSIERDVHDYFVGGNLTWDFMSPTSLNFFK